MGTAIGWNSSHFLARWSRAVVAGWRLPASAREGLERLRNPCGIDLQDPAARAPGRNCFGEFERDLGESLVLLVGPGGGREVRTSGSRPGSPAAPPSAPCDFRESFRGARARCIRSDPPGVLGRLSDPVPRGVAGLERHAPSRQTPPLCQTWGTSHFGITKSAHERARRRAWRCLTHRNAAVRAQQADRHALAGSHED